ncbi:MAG TPA: bifunctional demethylmenaquinone methyltransferase/2-methoxy-6-polyprenyl-1,4-benzoquinol methylase UbiE [Chitinophagales bacterium]|nr:bifunctional demethylmenaquinone methyltransferase/2-methoxy-6-polyprenyl-1,4-benzoquinol methylase UbiE [Chitinophagales bacterium]
MMKQPVVPYQEMNLSKKEQVSMMFDRIAFRYDLMNRLLSFGIDTGWRKRMLKMLRPSNPQLILDVATGTADVAIQLATLHPKHITGIDISAEMLSQGRVKINEKNLGSLISLQQADAENLPFEDNKFDAITVAFGVRNFEHLEKGLQELNRVLKKNGTLIVLEFSKPKQFPFRQLFRFYFTRICPLLGQWITNDKMAYTYLHRSVAVFPDGKDFTHLLEKNGFVSTQCTPLTFGISSIYTGKKQ